MTDGRTSYSQALAAFDRASIVATLSPEITIRVAVHDEPLRGRDTADFLFGVLTQELTPFKLVEEIVEEGKSVVLFETSLRGERAHGLNVVEHRPDGLVGVDRLLPSPGRAGTGLRGNRWPHGATLGGASAVTLRRC